MTRAQEIVERFARAFVAGRLDALATLLAADCVDANPVPIQPPGRDGVLLKAALFHAQYPGFVTTLVGTDDVGAGSVVATWTTRFPTGELTRWRGSFRIVGDAIACFEVVDAS